MKLIQHWPLDVQKGQAWDLGVRIREDVVAAFSEGDQTILNDPERCDKIYGSLEQLINNKHSTDFPTKVVVGAVCKNLEAAQNFTREEVRSSNLEITIYPKRK